MIDREKLAARLAERLWEIHLLADKDDVAITAGVLKDDLAPFLDELEAGREFHMAWRVGADLVGPHARQYLRIEATDAHLAALEEK